MLSVIQLALFLIFILYLPGYFLIKNSSIKKTASVIFVSICLGLVLFTISSLIGRFLDFKYLGLVCSLIFDVLFFIKNGFQVFSSFRLKISNKHEFLIVSLLIIAGTFFQTLISFKSGYLYDFGVGYWGPLAHDGVWHEALVRNLINTFPPQNPGLSGTLLTNYHYFYDLLVAETNLLTNINVRDLIYRFYPILFSSLLGLGTTVLVRKLFHKNIITYLSLFFVYFGSSFGWIVEFLKQGSILGGESTFWANQAVSMNINPPYAISLILLICAVYLFLLLQKKEKEIVFAFVLIASTLIGFKIYAGVIIVGALLVLAFIKFVLEKNWFYLFISLSIALISLIIFMIQTSKATSFLEFNPFWFVNSMIDDPDRVGWLRLASARSSYLSGGNYIKFFIVEVVSFVIFIAGNLGTKIVGFLSLKQLKVKIMISKESLMIWISLIAFLLPLVIVQKGNPWNTIQFFYYFLYFCSICAAYATYLLVKRFGFPGKLLLIFVLLITPISSFSTFRSGFQGAPAKISNEEESALAFLRSQKYGVVLTPVFNPEIRKSMTAPFPISIYETSVYVAAESGKPIFLEDEIQQDIFQNDYRSRKDESNKFFSVKDNLWSQDFLKRNQISYIYIPKLYVINLKEESLNIRKIYENSETLVYLVK